MLVGMNYLGDSTTDSRGALIQQFNAKVQAWNDGEREAMAGLTLTVGGGAGRQRPLAEVELEDSSHQLTDLGSQPTDGAIGEWVPLFYQNAMVQVGTPTSSRQLQLSGASGGKDSTVLWRDGGHSSLISCKDTTIDVQPCSDTCSSSRRRRRGGGSSSCTTCRSKCEGRGGSYNNGQCTAHDTLQEINLVASGSGDSWRFSGFSLTGTHTDPGTWTSSGGSCPPPPPTVTVPFTVRSEADPYVQAARLTGYSLDFGNTQKENATIGVELLVIGAILTGIPCLSCFFIYKCLKEGRGRQRRGMRSDGQPLGMGVQQPAAMPMQPMQPMVPAAAAGQYVPPQMGGVATTAAANPVYTAGMPMQQQMAVPAAATAVPMQQQQQQYVPTVTPVVAPVATAAVVTPQAQPMAAAPQPYAPSAPPTL